METTTKNLAPPLAVLDGTYKAVVVSGRFSVDRRERGRFGVVLVLRVEGPVGPAELELFVGIDDSIGLEALSFAFSRGRDFLVSTDPSETVGTRVWAVVRNRPWQPGLDPAEVTSISRRCTDL